MFKRIAKSISKALLGPYRLQWIYRADLSTLASEDMNQHDLRSLSGGEEMLLAEDPVIRDHAYFSNGEAHAFGLWEDGKLACSCVIWDVERAADIALGTLGNTDAVLVDIVTATSHRQRGLALATIRFAMMEMARKGYQTLVCTIWHNHWASIRTFEKAGWRCEALVIGIFQCGRKLTFRFAKQRPRVSIRWTRP